MRMTRAIEEDLANGCSSLVFVHDKNAIASQRQQRNLHSIEHIKRNGKCYKLQTRKRQSWVIDADPSHFLQ